MITDNKYDVIVIGAGHAGCEAAHATAIMGARTLLVTMDMNKIAQMSCNPAVGGIAKGQIVREIDAMGGMMGLVTDASTIQFRMLNLSKGPAMWSPRAQCDRSYFVSNWRYVIEHTPNLYIWQDTVSDLIITKGGRVGGVITELGARFSAKRVIITAGTFLNGKIFIGKSSAVGGRIGEPTSNGLTERLIEVGIKSGRMKTGTPPRIDSKSLDLSKLEIQHGDERPARFSFLNVPSSAQASVNQKCCYIVHTNPAVHKILKAGFKDSPLFNGRIKGIGPRYCPSIEDKICTFAGRDQHLLFLEPEGWNTNEFYLQGFSSSLPLQTQMKALHHIEGLENVEIFRPAYAIEYDYFPPTQLYNSLESRLVKGLFFAGQVNGTTGYEEAAAQGLIAGINTVLSIRGKEPFILKRNESYIGVLIDDLVTKGVDEPYRMFTSRAEFRILLRQDNADYRLTPYGNMLGLASDQRMYLMEEKYRRSAEIEHVLDSDSITPKVINPILKKADSQLIDASRKCSSILCRPAVSLSTILPAVPRGTEIRRIAEEMDSLFPAKAADDRGLLLPFRAPGFSLKGRKKTTRRLSEELLDSVDIAIKYRSYILREQKSVEKFLRLEKMKIPATFDYKRVSSLSTEGRQKLIKYKPTTLAAASRIPGVSPADISVLLVYFGR